MRYRTFGRVGGEVSEVGYGMWGLAGWTGSDDTESLDSLRRSIELGCTFFDTAWGYGAGHSERLLGKIAREFPARRLFRDPPVSDEMDTAARMATPLSRGRPQPRVRRGALGLVYVPPGRDRSRLAVARSRGS